jgi:8-oxo-dGTP pyrophosphatase MutT (NUDIX family)
LSAPYGRSGGAGPGSASGTPRARPEFSAGGLVVRRFRGRPFVAAVRVKGGSALALPKGHPEPGESAAEAATREVLEETGLRAVPVRRLGDVKYWYVREGRRVLKIVAFFLFHYRSGTIRDHDHEVDSVEWVPLAEAPRLLSYPGERKVAEDAMSSLADHL